MNVLMVEPGKAPYETQIGMICKVCRQSSADISKPCIPTNNQSRWFAASLESWMVCRSTVRCAMRMVIFMTLSRGNFLSSDSAKSDFTDLPHELAEQFAEQFRQPEIFMHVDDKIVAAPMPDEQVQGGMSY